MATIKKLEMTKQGLIALTAELDELVKTKRPKLVERLSHARAEGDLSENSDYTNAKEELEFLDGRITELNEVLKYAVVVDGTTNGGASVGTSITVKVNGEKHVYEMVGEWEADPMSKKISPESPLGSALMGKKKGERVEVEAPAGKIVYEILEVK